ncbi:DEAD/DEAH box helicase [Limnothrix sp. FACHB-1083]|uniref:DEAD/DEAH box helicase n=1 Tax=unclassified Limnothrix TaxID=2632864 RepID=UPI0016807BC2|nr:MULTISPECIES: DEAD/DEAH box helicase [unclassified Limnothrix]MBD2161366.1 DEAD/DEAH box helicase [Limnothrix sp. FACHB-1083]MBD2192122.1 DEAD/DEAH box helicase [Limnothrix sp. FACHB-1088]
MTGLLFTPQVETVANRWQPLNAASSIPVAIRPQAFELRDYQKALITGIYRSWEQHRRVMAQLPTAGGKTILFAGIVNEFVSRGEGVLVLAHRTELIRQAHGKIFDALGRRVGVGMIKSGIHPSPLAPVQVASVQTLAKRAKPAAGLVIIDEAHHASAKTYRDILSHYPSAFVLGVTATPCRTDGSGFDDLFDVLVCGPSVAEMLARGYLCPVRVLAPDPSARIDMKGARSRKGGDYLEGELTERVDKVLGEVVPTWQEYANGKSTLVFVPSIESGESVLKEYRDAGIGAELLTGKTGEKDRENMISRFTKRAYPVLINVGVLTEGTDIPIVEAIQCLRPTVSLALWLQIIGRAMRLHPDKVDSILIDHTENWLNHGLPEQERIWTLKGIETFEAKEKRERKEREEKVRDEFVQAELDLGILKFVDVSTDRGARIALSLASWVGTCNKRGYKRMWVAYRFEEFFPDASLEECGLLRRVLGYKHGWEKHFKAKLEEKELQSKFAVGSPQYQTIDVSAVA